jgi:dihydrofolate reductase
MLNNLIDKYCIFINPIILGQGLSIFPKQVKSIDLKFKTAKTFPCGVTALYYTIAEN